MKFIGNHLNKRLVLSALAAVLALGGIARGQGLILVDKPVAIDELVAPRHHPHPHPHPHPWPPHWPPHPPRPRPIQRYLPLELRTQQVVVEINDQVAKTKVKQVFYNPSPRRLEGTFMFPVPAGAQVEDFQMEIDGKMMKAELIPADKARKIYEDIVRRAKDPALFEYAGRSLFKVRIFPIEPNSEKEIRLEYSELLPKDGKMVSYIYPLNTKKYSSRPIRDLSMKISIEASDGKRIKSVYSPSHELEITKKGGNRAVAGIETNKLVPDADLHIYYALEQEEKDRVDLDLLTHNPDGADEPGNLMLLISPGDWTEGKKRVEKDVIFVFDSSGSMRGAKMEQAKKALDFCIGSLGEGDRFEVIRFSTEAEAVFDEMVEATDKNQKKALSWVEDVNAIGGTAIEEALTMAIDILGEARKKGRPAQIIFMTDGKPTVGTIKKDVIVRSVKKHIDDAEAKVRVFCFGIGTEVNTHLLDEITSTTGAVSQYVLPEEDIEYKVSRFYAKIADPVLSDLKLKFDGPEWVKNVYPKDLPDLFKGDQLVVLGRYQHDGEDGKVTLSGMVNGEDVSFDYDVAFGKGKDRNKFIPKLWATRRVGYLLEEIRLHGENKELKEEVTELARKYAIVTPYTSYLILEDEARRDIPLARRSMPELERGRGIREELEAEADAFLDARSGADAVAGASSSSELKFANRLGDATKAEGSALYGRAKKLAESLPKPGSPAAGGAGEDGGELYLFGGVKLNKELAQSLQSTRLPSKQVGGKTFYANGATWVDADVQAVDETKPVKKIVFGTDEYFTFLTKHPEATNWFALGSSIRVVVDGEVIEIVDPEAKKS